MSDDMHTFIPSRSDLLTPPVIWGVGTLGLVVLALMGPRSGDNFWLTTSFVAVWSLVWLKLLVNSIFWPTLMIDEAGITWKRHWISARFIPWSEIAQMRTGLRFSLRRRRAEPAYQEYYIEVESATEKLRIGEGVVNEDQDLKVIAHLLDEGSTRFGTGIRMNDEAELLVMYGPQPRILRDRRE